MPGPQLFDHVLVAVLVAVLPLSGAWEYRRLTRGVRAGDPHARTRAYRSTIIVEWALAAGVVAFWWVADRPAAELGFAVSPGVRLALGAVVTTAGLGILYLQWRAVRAMSPDRIASLTSQVETVAEFIPRTRRERRLFSALSVSAGVCEEVVYRGYLIWYLAAWVGLWPATVAAALIFAILHLYQGYAGVLKTGITGLLMAALFVATGSLLWPIILHIAIDFQGGAIGRRALAPPSAAGAARGPTLASGR